MDQRRRGPASAEDGSRFRSQLLLQA
jgi:hypothetical protein